MTGIFVALNGRLGAMYHVGFPVANRASFGIWGSLWPIFNRAAMGKHSLSSGALPRHLLTTHSVCLVWCSSLHWWSLCLSHDPLHLEVMGS